MGNECGVPCVCVRAMCVCHVRVYVCERKVSIVTMCVSCLCVMMPQDLRFGSLSDIGGVWCGRSLCGRVFWRREDNIVQLHVVYAYDVCGRRLLWHR